MKAVACSLAGLGLTYLIVSEFGLIGLLISLPFFAVAPWAWSMAKDKWRRRNALR